MDSWAVASDDEIYADCFGVGGEKEEEEQVPWEVLFAGTGALASGGAAQGAAEDALTTSSTGAASSTAAASSAAWPGASASVVRAESALATVAVAAKKKATVAVAAKKKARQRAPPRRQLKRKASEGKPAELRCENRLCLWGEKFKAPAVIHPMYRRGGKWFFPIHERLYWLRRACGDASTTHWTGKFQQALSALRRHLKRGIRQKVDAFGAAAATMREALGLNDSDEEDGLGPKEDGLGPKKKAKKQPRLRTPEGLEEVAVDIGSTSVKVRTRQRPFEVEASADAVMAVVQFCCEFIEKDALAPKKRAASATAFVLATPDCPPVLGCVTWHASVQAWSVHWKDAESKAHVKRVLVQKRERKVGFMDAASAQEDAKSAWATARRVAYQEALALWNELDKSTRDRIAVPGSQSAMTAA